MFVTTGFGVDRLYCGGCGACCGFESECCEDIIQKNNIGTLMKIVAEHKKCESRLSDEEAKKKLQIKYPRRNKGKKNDQNTISKGKVNNNVVKAKPNLIMGAPANDSHKRNDNERSKLHIDTAEKKSNASKNKATTLKYKPTVWKFKPMVLKLPLTKNLTTTKKTTMRSLVNGQTVPTRVEQMNISIHNDQSIAQISTAINNVPMLKNGNQQKRSAQDVPLPSSDHDSRANRSGHRRKRQKKWNRSKPNCGATPGPNLRSGATSSKPGDATSSTPNLGGDATSSTPNLGGDATPGPNLGGDATSSAPNSPDPASSQFWDEILSDEVLKNQLHLICEPSKTGTDEEFLCQ
eukprot:CAMPEP_0113849624 /NCGR_PEP_ID=MMETSP0372-20130328/3271_1 /TAXON_ID=340204 /ORGANISM="Lankesteria abbotti" /LENGTH=348 /DNA_ID=CAMNT_0000819509 /DNA_START=334 /DNA_END=1377 /DNA_ORIENTATION=- /assembly_acc=CAM_ASM_000359